MKFINTFSSTKLFFTLSALLLAAFLIGGVIPQGEPPQKYQEMFGSLGSVWVMKFHLYDVFSSFWFLILISLSAINILACTVKQWKLIKLRPGLFLSHSAVILMFVGGSVRGLFSLSGNLDMEVGKTKNEFINAEGKNEPLPFEVMLKDFQIHYWEQEKHIIHAIKEQNLLESVEVKEGNDAHFKSAAPDLRVLKFYPNFSIGNSGPASLNDARENPALAVVLKNEKKTKPQYLFAKYPDFHGVSDEARIRFIYEYLPGRIKQFESRIGIIENGVQKMEKLISVNSPADYKGYHFYQSGYDAKNLKFSTIQVSKDPSVIFIYTGFVMLMIGLTWVFWREMK